MTPQRARKRTEYRGSFLSVLICSRFHSTQIFETHSINDVLGLFLDKNNLDFDSLLDYEISEAFSF